ncbi:conserved hypothetical protein, secreted [Candidatus Magnetomorum sp. HK-1]|nr:conserved hypothetical protein, secreted [Candidatus Magnetomorum sp. HK-1]
MTTIKQMNLKKGIIYFYAIIFFLSISASVQALEWTYYDIEDNAIQNPTTEEIESTAVMRISDTGVTQYSLEISHDFSGTWGTGYLENIGNPSPGVGKHWMNLDEEVVCNVDGIVQDVYSLNSRYVTMGYYAQGPPNATDKASALVFDGQDDYASTDSIDINNPYSISITFWAKRDRTKQAEWLISQIPGGLYFGFDAEDKAIFGIPHGSIQSNITTDTAWHKWRLVVEAYTHNFYEATGQGFKMWLFRDDVELAYNTIKPAEWSNQHPYMAQEEEIGCYLLDMTSTTGGDNEYDNTDWNQCQEEWGSYSYSDYSDGCSNGHPLQICADYGVNIGLGQAWYRCDQCYRKGIWVPEATCKVSWWGSGMHNYGNYNRYNGFTYKDMLKARTVSVERFWNSHHCGVLQYAINGSIIFGRGYTGGFFQGKLKDIDIRQNGVSIGIWKLDDGNESSVAVDTSGNNRNSTLNNFDTKSCWMMDPKLQKYYKNSKIQERQTVKKFKMTSPGKIVYDWGRQHAVIVNTLPESLSDKVFVEVVGDGTQNNNRGSGKYWYNHNSNIVIWGNEGSCQKLSGYRDNNANTKTINSNRKNAYNLNQSQNISWIYSPYLFEETVTIGSPVVLSTFPPDVMDKIDLSKKPRYISTDVTETDMCFWNDAEKRMYPLRAGEIFDLEYELTDSDCVGIKAIVRVKTIWPESSHIIHVANTPPVNLDPLTDDEVAFINIKHVEADAVVSNKKFSSTKKGRSVLHFMRNYIEDTLPKEISLSFDGQGYAETEQMGLPDSFTIEFFARHQSRDDLNVVIGQGPAQPAKSLIIGFENNQFIFHYYGYALTTTTYNPDNMWHHWACVYETDTSEINNDSGKINTDSFICDNDPENNYCKWNDNTCYTEDFIGDYVIKDDQRNWSQVAKAKRRCGKGIKYKRKIYCDGNLVAETESDIPFISQGENFRIGTLGWAQFGGFKGQLDELRIWSAARTQFQISSNMNLRLNGNEENLKAYYPMDKVGSTYLDDNCSNHSSPTIATLKYIDPSNSWIVETEKLFALEPQEIPVLGNTCIRVVETRLESEDKTEASSIVGYEITGLGIHDSRVPHNGYVFYENVPHNMNIYNRNDLQGSIYPVNTINPTPGGRNSILVIWYKMQDSVSWPYQPTEYSISWPNDGNRIVIASRMGSDGKNEAGIDQLYPDINNENKNYFDPARYQDILIYNQPNPLIPGYNPNEEHAIATSSFRHSSAAPRPYAAFALRNDLNITANNSNYTSDPYVLVQYFDTVLNRHGMKPFKVEREDPSCGYMFNYNMKAGDPVVPPYPLNEVIGATPPKEIFGKNVIPTQNSFWKDHKGQSWAISASGMPMDINSVTLSKTETNYVEYQINLENDTLLENHRYAVKVVDDRGFIGMMSFIVNEKNTQIDSNKTSVYVDGLPISASGGTFFKVKIRPAITNLVAGHFKLYSFENTSANIAVNYWYPLQPSFWLDQNTPGDSTGNVGVSLPWLPIGKINSSDGFPEDMVGMEKATQVTYDVYWPDEVSILKAGESITFPGGENRAENNNAQGLPAVLAWASGQIVYDSLNPLMNSNDLLENYMARLVPVLLERKVAFPIASFPEDLQPASKRVEVIMNRWYFKELHAGLKKRIYYDPTTQELVICGFVNDKTLGDSTLTASPPSIYILQPNILTDRELATIQGIEGADNTFNAKVQELYQLSRNPKKLSDIDYGVGLELYKNCVTGMLENHIKQEKLINDMFYAWLGSDIANQNNRIIPQIALGPGLAVVPNGGLLDPNNTTFNNFKEGYITLAENNHPDLGALPISLHIIKIVKEKVRGAVKTVFSDNVFDEKITLRHSADFGANPNDLIFQWWYREENGTEQPTPDYAPSKWLIFPDPTGQDGLGMSEVSLVGAGAVLLVDNLFYCRYRHKNSNPDNPLSWSNWAGSANSSPEKYQPQLAEGWVKRVLNGINPFEARIKNFYNSDSPATYISMIRQAGSRYEGPVAFNPDKDVIENVGLIELYQTVLNRSMDLSINLEQPASTSGITSALLLATTRISSFYVLLGNEAYNDALDPTIGFGTDSVEYGSLAPTIFSFMNQTPDLIDEEFSLLCGRQGKGARPAYNRLLWNFTKGEGEAAYALSYNINDVDFNGLINEADGRILYPQGHGDAWGHYLTAVKCYYDLLGHPEFNWESRSEKFSVEGVVIDVDYFDERKFSEAAAAKAKVGNEIVNITYRKEYVEDPDGQWQGYKDTDKDRAWGVTGWARRAYLGALFDWAMANAIIPAIDNDPTHTGLKKIDRTTVADILEIASQARSIQQQYANSNNGLNPLGLATDVVPFDVNPARMNPEALNTATHFEQVYENALEAMENARAVFDHASDLKNRIREVTVSEQEFADQVIDKDREYKNQLIEMFGTPYEGTIGAGKAYPPGYSGPDYYFYAYIDVNEVSEETVPPASKEMKINFGPQDSTFTKDDYGTGHNDLPTIFSQFFDADLEGSAYESTDFSGVVEITFPMSTGTYSFQAPSDWGMRKSPGEIQIALIELIKAEAGLQLALSQYAGLMGEISYKTKILKGRTDLNDSELAIGDKWRDQTEKFNAAMATLRNVADISEVLGEEIKDVCNAEAESLPTIVGPMANDVNSVPRAALQAKGILVSRISRGIMLASKAAADGVETQKELAELDMQTELQKANYKYDIQQILAEIEGLLGNEAPIRMEIFKQREHMRQVSEKYRSMLAKGLRLLEERKAYNARVAQKTQGKRYMDMAFRLNLNKSLSKYRNAFDMAARYVYLAAKAYDYDTNLSDRDPASAKPFLTDIVKQRHLGQYKNGQYLLGQGGLGDILATMKINYNVLKSQMGFNSPQTETGRFSLRSELMRIKHEESSENAWRDELKKKCVENLWTIPEFRKFCRPFASEKLGEQPGLVIDFGTKILFGKNFFGWPLSGGDHAYDPTNFATKVRSVGVWFDGYDNSLLSETPRVYLVPVGMDVMLVPDSTELDTREWTVIDQKLPIPLPVRGSDLNNPNWIPSLDSLDGSMIQIRRFSSFRAYHDSGYFDANQVSFESRLVGRSVWNTRWMLIIPGGTFHYDSDYGLDTFIDNVKDIKLFFQTYAISGN